MFNQSWTHERKQKIQGLNAVLGTNYCVTPFNLKNPEDLQEIVEEASGYYLDSLKIAWQIDEISEVADESLETFFPTKWTEAIIGEVSKDTPLQTLCLLLDKTSAEARKVQKDAEKICKDVWKMFLDCAPSDVTKKLTTARDTKDLNWDDVLGELIELDDLPYSTEEAAITIGKIIGKLKTRKKVS